MFNIGAGEMILIALVLLIAVGPEQLPGVIRRAGRLVSQVRSMSDGLRRDFMDSMDEIDRAADPRKWADTGFDSEQTVARFSNPPARLSEGATSVEAAPEENATDEVPPDEALDDVPPDEALDDVPPDEVPPDEAPDEVAAGDVELDSIAVESNGDEVPPEEVAAGDVELDSIAGADVGVEQEQ